jgi:hypothetical protein
LFSVNFAPFLEFLPSVALGIGLAACAGLRAWLPLLLAGGLARLGFLELGDSFQFITSDRALLLFGVATLVEIVADKLPAVDHALDVVSTIVRPAAASLLAASVMWKISDPLVALALGVAIGAPSALVPHAAKSALRVASSGATAGLANPVLSLVEDLVAIAIFVLAILVPLAIVAAVAVATFWIVRRRRARSRAGAAMGVA